MNTLRVLPFLFILLSLSSICLITQANNNNGEDSTTDSEKPESEDTTTNHPDNFTQGLGLEEHDHEDDSTEAPPQSIKAGGESNQEPGGGSNANSGGGGGGSNAGPLSTEDKLGEEDQPEEAISNEDEDSHKRNRHFPKCKCLQKFRTSYLTGNVCGRAALCYWELWNYKYLKKKALGAEELEEYKKVDSRCHRYMIEKHTCLIGYPPTRTHNHACDAGLENCETELASLLFQDCDPLRQAYGLPKPQDVDWEIKTENLNYDMSQDKDTIFRARPTPEHPKWNNYYAISCPVVFRYPFFTIDLLLKDLDPTIKYDETSALKGVAELIPKYAREGMNNERILNFDALSLDESYIHWCGIPRNYVCVRVERDKKGQLCSEKRLEKFRRACEPSNTPNPREKKAPESDAEHQQEQSQQSTHDEAHAQDQKAQGTTEEQTTVKVGKTQAKAKQSNSKQDQPQVKGKKAPAIYHEPPSDETTEPAARRLKGRNLNKESKEAREP